MAIRVSELREPANNGGYPELEDRLLVLDFQAGNEQDAYLEIHRRYARLARHVCLRILGNAEDAEDATQEAMLRVFQGLQRFNGRFAVQPWVARIATNVSLDVVRARSRRPQASDRPFEDLGAVLEPGDPEAAVERLLDRERVNQILAQLPEHHRRALVLREFEGRSHEEIGDALGVTPPQAKALIHRAKKSFRQAWGAVGHSGRLAGAVAFWLPSRLFSFGRRVVERVADAGQVMASSDVISSAAQAPAIVNAGAHTSERVVAAAVTVLVAGTVTFGAATLSHRDRDRPEVVPTKTHVAPVPAMTPTTPADVEAKRIRKRVLIHPVVPAGTSEGTKEGRSEGVDDTSGVGETTTTASDADPSAPPPAPSPAWSAALDISTPTYDCGCEGFTLLGEKVHGNVVDGVTFDQTVEGRIPGPDGGPDWTIRATLFGGANKDGTGAGGASFVLIGNGGRLYTYEATASLTRVTEGDDGWLLTYEGTFAPITVLDGGDLQPILSTGRFFLTVAFGQDGTTLYRNEVRLEGDASKLSQVG